MDHPSVPPRILFKYRYFDEDGYHLKSLTDIYFPPPAEFNDPFDTGIPILYYSSGTSPDDILKHMRRRNSELNNPILSEKELIERHRDFISEIPSNIVDAQARDLELASKNARETGVFSLAEKETSILMWSHYGRNHTGFCIGYRTNILYDFLRSQADVILPYIKYSPICPVINPYDPSLTLDEYYEAFTAKHSDWSYECEWRLIYHYGARKSIQIPENTIDRVYLGMRIKPDNEARLIETLRTRKIKVDLFRAYRQFNNFELKFEVVKY